MLNLLSGEFCYSVAEFLKCYVLANNRIPLAGLCMVNCLCMNSTHVACVNCSYAGVECLTTAIDHAQNYCSRWRNPIVMGPKSRHLEHIQRQGPLARILISLTARSTPSPLLRPSQATAILPDPEARLARVKPPARKPILTLDTNIGDHHRQHSLVYVYPCNPVWHCSSSHRSGARAQPVFHNLSRAASQHLYTRYASIKPPLSLPAPSQAALGSS